MIIQVLLSIATGLKLSAKSTPGICRQPLVTACDFNCSHPSGSNFVLCIQFPYFSLQFCRFWFWFIFNFCQFFVTCSAVIWYSINSTLVPGLYIWYLSPEFIWGVNNAVYSTSIPYFLETFCNFTWCSPPLSHLTNFTWCPKPIKCSTCLSTIFGRYDFKLLNFDQDFPSLVVHNANPVLAPRFHFWVWSTRINLQALSNISRSSSC